MFVSISTDSFCVYSISRPYFIKESLFSSLDPARLKRTRIRIIHTISNIRPRLHLHLRYSRIPIQHTKSGQGRSAHETTRLLSQSSHLDRSDGAETAGRGRLGSVGPHFLLPSYSFFFRASLFQQSGVCDRKHQPAGTIRAANAYFDEKTKSNEK